jgi:hypothetical protein
MDNIIQFKDFERPVKRNEDECREYWQEQYERRKESRLHIHAEEIESKVINNENVVNIVGKLLKVTFKNIEQVEQFEKQECENQPCENSWMSCKEKFNKFPCVIYCRFTKRGILEGYVAQYITKDEYIAELKNQLLQAV